jgi:hypothetical protein
MKSIEIFKNQQQMEKKKYEAPQIEVHKIETDGRLLVAISANATSHDYGENVVTGTLPGYTEGSSSVTGELPGFTEGSSSTTGTLPGYTEGNSGTTGTLPGYTNGTGW